MPSLREVVADARRPRDLRALALGLSGWVGGLVALGLPGAGVLVLLALAAAALWLVHRRGRPVATGVACLLAAVAVGGVCAARTEAVRAGPVARLADESAAVTVRGKVATDPATRTGRFGDVTLVRVTATEVVGRGQRHRTSVPVLVIGDEGWGAAELGSRVEVTGRLGPADGADLAGVLSTGRAPVLLEEPGELLAGAATLRSGIRAAVAGGPGHSPTLVPALVVGDDQRLPPSVVADFQTSGLTHLTAVSGTNLTLVVGSVLILARWAGLRARALLVVGIVGVLGFVLLARPEPSVLRAAAMGSVALLGMSSRGPDQGLRALGVAILVLLLLDPWLVVSLGFVLSSLATGGILLLGPAFRDALQSWLPRWAAEALAVPLAAQLACTPVVAAISGQVSLVAVLANLAVAAAVGPATVLGLLGGLVVLVVPTLGQAVGWAAGLCGWWIIAVATHLARLPTAAVDWAAGPVSLAGLTVLCVLVAVTSTALLRRRRWVVVVAAFLALVMLRPLPSPGWPPRDWVMVACDVGQGDGLVLNAGGGAAVVVDTGPDPEAMDRCLDRIGVDTLPVVVLTHFHADHVDALPAVLDDRRVGELAVTATEDPASGAADVRRWASRYGVPVRVPGYGEVRRVGQLTWQVLGPQRRPLASGTGASTPSGEKGSEANNASLVLLVGVRGTRILLTGDIEPEAQRDLIRSLPGLRVDVLKVPHHGSRYQDQRLLTGLGARLAVVSAGADNDYGHPAAATLAALHHAGATVARTDQVGDVAVTVRDGELGVLGRRPR